MMMPAYPMRDPDYYVTDFSEYATGAQPSSWTRRWGAGFTALVQTSAGSLSGKALRWTKTSAARQALSWDRVPVSINVEILVRLRAIEAWANNDNIMGVVARGGGAAGSESGYRATVSGLTSGTLYASASNKYGPDATLGTSTPGPSPNLAVNDWVWMRFRVNGSSLSRKTWHQGASEPGAFDETLTDTSIAGAGWVGLAQVTGNPDCEIDFFSVAVRGKTASMVKR
jgi:hypothetical protein